MSLTKTKAPVATPPYASALMACSHPQKLPSIPSTSSSPAPPRASRIPRTR
ncbi:hypothetical protein EMPG_13687 [Blastomyces silverae]|uniref:Uncharacterized protein n=1 Tax=Blastomyces silverae TaxID=2060906 RepID=A0A0H1BI58_9EURO|nr:hypothetical protein EMPG_13687 [Blastomyces silverae]